MSRAAPAPLATALAGLLLLAGCALPAADGTEATLAARAAELPALTPASGHDAASVVRNGLLLHPGVREAASRISASADEVRVQRAALFPSLGLSLGGGKGAAGQGKPALELTGQQLIVDFGDTKRAVTAADLDVQINYIAFQQTVDAAAVEVLTAYDAVRRYARLTDIRRQQLTAMRELQGLVSERISAGAAPAPDMLETRKRLQAAEFAVHDTELALAEARDRLTRLSGQARGGALPALRGSCAATAGADDLRIARLQLAKAELDLDRAERARLPRINLAPIARARDGEGVKLGLNLGVDSDLLAGGAHTARANAARNRREAAQAGTEAASRNAGLDERALQRQIAGSARRMEMLRRQIELLAETRTLYRSQYLDLGTRQISDLLDNEEELYNRRAELIETESELGAARLECAVRDRSLRRAAGLAGSSIHGYPLAPDAP